MIHIPFILHNKPIENNYNWEQMLHTEYYNLLERDSTEKEKKKSTVTKISVI